MRTQSTLPMLLLFAGVQAQGMPSSPLHTNSGDSATEACPSESSSRSSDDVEHMVAAEEWIKARTSAFKALKQDLLDLRLPGPRLREFCMEEVLVGEPGALTLAHDFLDGTVAHFEWRSQTGVECSSRKAADALELWWPMIADFERIEQVQVGVLDARFVPEGEAHWQARLKLSCSGYRSDGGSLGFVCYVDTSWSPAGRGALASKKLGAGAWKLSRFETRRIQRKEAVERCFEDVTDAMIADVDLAARLSQSGQDQALLEKYFDGAELPTEFLMNANPGLSVVDINGDGFDDLYLLPRHRPNLLLVNTGAGSFEEQSARYGLDLPGACSSAAFADLDNDGDLDLVLGRVTARSQVFERDGERYADVSTRFRPELPTKASAVALADFNRDGVLDVYIATYEAGPLAVQGSAILQLDGSGSNAQGPSGANAPDEFFGLKGPSNALFLSEAAGRWSLARGAGAADVAAHTLGASCSDYDNDGDVDIYCANDFGPDVLLNNDGRGVFTDVTASVDLLAGFGMGASWGDYDGDGLFDLYVSNMYSKAGTRISGVLPALREHVSQAATGNFLLRNTGNGFVLASDNRGQGQKVSKAGWCYSAQFLDVNNDARLDLFAPNGYYTAPKGLAKDEDL